MRVLVIYGTGDQQMAYEFDSSQIFAENTNDFDELTRILRGASKIVVQGPHKGERTIHNLLTAHTVRITT